MKKKLLLVATLVLSALVLVSCNFKKDLILYLPNDYIEKDVIKAFEKEYKVKVGVVNFNSNEIALGQIKSNSYDLVIPSDYALEELAKEDYLEELDWSQITFDKKDFNSNLSVFIDELKEEGFDLLKYSMPYYWGTIGLIYNNSKPGLKEKVEKEGWNILADQSITKMVYDSSRDSFMVALAKDNIKLSEATKQNIEDAKKWLISIKGSKTSIKSDEILNEAIGGKTPYDVAVVYSGDAVYIMQETSKYSFHIPELTNIWVDGFAIPKNAKNKELAYKFINWFSSYEQNLENTEEIAYTSIRQDVTDYLITTEDFSEARIKEAFLVDNIRKYEFFRYNNELKKQIDEAWTNVKTK